MPAGSARPWGAIEAAWTGRQPMPPPGNGVRQSALQGMARLESEFAVQPLDVGQKHRRFPGRRLERAEPHKVATADLTGYPIDQLRDRKALIRADIHRALEPAVQHGGECRADVGNVQEAAYLPAVRARSLAIREQIADYRGHQALGVLIGTELKKDAPPCRRKPAVARILLEEALQGDLALGIGRGLRGSVRRERAR